MTILDLLFSAAITMGALAMAAVTPQDYRPMVYLILLGVWGFVTLYLILPEGALNRQLYHWGSWHG